MPPIKKERHIVLHLLDDRTISMPVGQSGDQVLRAQLFLVPMIDSYETWYTSFFPPSKYVILLIL